MRNANVVKPALNEIIWLVVITHGYLLRCKQRRWVKLFIEFVRICLVIICELNFARQPSRLFSLFSESPNTIVAKNKGGGSDANATFSAGSSYNLIGNGDGAGIANGVNGNLVGATGTLLDPKVGLLADNGGKTKNHAVLPGSPAIDAIPTGSCAVSDDQHGVSRPQVAGCDMGAYEYEFIGTYLPIVVKNN